MSTFTHIPNVFTSKLIAKLKNHPKRVVFVEGEDIRVLRAAEQLVAHECVLPVVLGDRDRIRALAADNDISLNFINVLNPEKSRELDRFASMFEKSSRVRGVDIPNGREFVIRPAYFASMMAQYGLVDGLIGGNMSMPSTLFRALIQTIKPMPQVPKIFSTIVLVAPHLKNFGINGTLILADCGLIPEPTVEQLAVMAVETGKFTRRYTEIRPEIALLSHSTRGSSGTQGAQRVAAATRLAQTMAKDQHLDLDIDGELQADVALDPKAAEIKLPEQIARPGSHVLIFPNLDSAHIALMLLTHCADAQNYGQFIMGLSRPAAQIPRTSSEETIFGTALTVGYEAIKFHELYPEGEV